MDNIAEMHDTLKRISEDSRLSLESEKTNRETKVYKEGFRSSRCPQYPPTVIEVREETTFRAARSLLDTGMKIAVLNSAHPTKTGGALWNGSGAQEERLCRMSTLYPSLTSPEAEEFYTAHREQRKREPEMHFFKASGNIVYSPDVTVFKEEYDANNIQLLRYTEKSFNVDVLSVAAPFFNSDYTAKTFGYDKIYALFKSRIETVLEVAIESGDEALILREFGCSSFNSPASVVAEAFSDVLSSKRYKNAFKKIVFAITVRSFERKNLEEFRIRFKR